MSRRAHPATGLEGAPDIMLLMMSALMVAIVWLVAHAHERTLPPVELPSSGQARLGASVASAVHVSLRPDADGALGIWVEDQPVPSGMEGLEAVLRERDALEVQLRADSATRWEDVLGVMSIAARLGLEVSAAADRP